MTKGRVLGLVLLAVFLAGNLALARPFHNWDTIGYIGVAYRMQGLSGDELHATVFREARAHLPEEDYVRNTTNDAYREAVLADPASLEQQVPFYAVKPMYPALMSALMSLGVNPVQVIQVDHVGSKPSQALLTFVHYAVGTKTSRRRRFMVFGGE